MCSKEETRQIIREENPKWVRIALSTIVLGLGSWLLLSVHNQDVKMGQMKSAIKEDIQTILVSQATFTSAISGKLTQLTDNIQDIRGDFSSRTSSRIALEDERYTRMTSLCDDTRRKANENANALRDLYRYIPQNHNNRTFNSPFRIESND